MTCRELIDLLAEYLEASLSPNVIAELERHLRDCPPCVAYLNTYRRTRDVAADVNRVDMPDEMKSRLRAFLLERLRDTPGDLGPDI